MERNDYLRIFLGVAPEDGTTKYDYDRFISYVAACAECGEAPDFEAMRAFGLTEERIAELEIASDWIRYTLKWCEKSR